MVTTRSKSKPAAAVAAAPDSPTTPTTPISSLKTPETPITPPKRKRSKTYRGSPVPYKIRKTRHSPQESPRPQTLDVSSDSDHEEDVEEAQFSEDEGQEEPVPAIKSFGQDTFVTDWSDIGRQNSLEFFQAYPHDRNSTLCVRHFLRLADGWYIRRKPMVRAQLHAMLKDGVCSKPDFSDLSLPIDEDTWTVPSLQSFKDELSGKINDAQQRLDKEYKRVLNATLLAPTCELGNGDQQLKCALCPDDKPDFGSGEESTSSYTDKRIHRGHHPPEELDRVLRECRMEIRERRVTSMLKCGHESPIMILGGEKEDVVECEDCPHTQPASQSCWMPYKHALRVAGVRIPVEVGPARMALNSKVGHVSVGGLHFIVDDCLHEPLIKFRSTRFSQAHEMEGFDYHDEGDLKTVRFALSSEAAEDNHEYDYDEEFDQYRVGIANMEKLYWRPGAFEPTGCSDLFENCSCH